MIRLAIRATVSGVPTSGLADEPQITIRRQDTGVVIVNASDMVDKGGGHYAFDFTPSVPHLAYLWDVDADPFTTGQVSASERYFAGTFDDQIDELYRDHALDSVDKTIDENTPDVDYQENELGNGADIIKTVVKAAGVTTISRGTVVPPVAAQVIAAASSAGSAGGSATQTVVTNNHKFIKGDNRAWLVCMSCEATGVFRDISSVNIDGANVTDTGLLIQENNQVGAQWNSIELYLIRETDLPASIRDHGLSTIVTTINGNARDIGVLIVELHDLPVAADVTVSTNANTFSATHTWPANPAANGCMFHFLSSGANDIGSRVITAPTGVFERTDTWSEAVFELASGALEQAYGAQSAGSTSIAFGGASGITAVINPT